MNEPAPNNIMPEIEYVQYSPPENISKQNIDSEDPNNDLKAQKSQKLKEIDSKILRTYRWYKYLLWLLFLGYLISGPIYAKQFFQSSTDTAVPYANEVTYYVVFLLIMSALYLFFSFILYTGIQAYNRKSHEINGLFRAYLIGISPFYVGIFLAEVIMPNSTQLDKYYPIIWIVSIIVLLLISLNLDKLLEERESQIESSPKKKKKSKDPQDPEDPNN